MFAELKALRQNSAAQSSPSLIAAAGTLGEPGPTQSADAWDLLAEAPPHSATRKARLASSSRGGRSRRGDGRQADAPGYRLKSGAYFFQAEKFAEADVLLSRVAEDPSAGASRPRAGLLRALGRGRGLALGRPGVSQADYASALQDQVKRFPADPSASEARWLLGKLRLAESDRDGAVRSGRRFPTAARLARVSRGDRRPPPERRRNPALQ